MKTRKPEICVMKTEKGSKLESISVPMKVKSIQKFMEMATLDGGHIEIFSDSEIIVCNGVIFLLIKF